MAMGVICLSTWFFVALVTDRSLFLSKEKNYPDLQFTCFKKFKSEDNLTITRLICTLESDLKGTL